MLPPPPHSSDTHLNSLINNINLIILTPHGRSGSVFMQSLLDNHTNIVSFPSYIHNKHTYFMNPNETTKKNIDIFISKNKSFFTDDGYMLGGLGENGTEHMSIDVKTYSKILLDLSNKVAQYKKVSDKKALNLNNKTFFILKYIALAKYLKKDISRIKYILLYVDKYTELFSQLLADFPNLYFIAMVRDPKKTWDTWRTFSLAQTQNKIPEHNFLEHTLNYLEQFENLFINLSKIHKNNVKIIDLNRLHAKNINAMREIANWLDIKFEDSLLKSTFLGLIWWGNTANKTKTNTFDVKKSKLTFYDKLPKEEVMLYDYLFEKLYKVLSYDIGHQNIYFEDLKGLKTHFKSYLSIFAPDTHFIGSVLRREKAYYLEYYPKLSSILPFSILRLLNVAKVCIIVTKRHFKLYFLHMDITALRQRKERLNSLIDSVSLNKNALI